MKKCMKDYDKYFPVSFKEIISPKSGEIKNNFIFANNEEINSMYSDASKSTFEKVVIGMLENFSFDDKLVAFLKQKGVSDRAENDFIYNLFHSISFVAYKTNESKIFDLTAFPNSDLNNEEFYDLNIKTTKGRNDFAKKIFDFIVDYEQTLAERISVGINPYRLNTMFKCRTSSTDNYFIALQKFSFELKRIMNTSSCVITNLEKFLNGQTKFNRLEFDIPIACIKYFFKELHAKVSDTSVIKAPKRVPAKFLFNGIVAVKKIKNTTLYTPLHISHYENSKFKDCGNYADIDIAISMLF